MPRYNLVTASQQEDGAMATTLSFKSYRYGSADVLTLSEIVEWDFYPEDWQAQATAAGFDPDDDELGLGSLQEDWNGHPAGALVVSGLTTEGHPFAVSNEVQGSGA